MTDDELLRELRTCVAPCDAIYAPYGRHAPECEWDIKEEAAERIEALLLERPRFVPTTADAESDDAFRVALSGVRWTREDVQRVLYHIVTYYEEAVNELGGDSELLRDAIRIGKQTLIDNKWWPNND